MKFPLLVLLAAGALSAPFNQYYDFVGVSESKCDNPRRLAEHATSLFDYEGETLSTIQGSTPDSTGIRMRARVYIHPQGACRFSMQINNAELLVKSKNTNGFSPAEESRKFARELEANDIIFETADGKIERLFPSSAESMHILNIKRGILSTLQLGENSAEEVDVNGRCKVSVTEQDGMIIKSKNLSECSERAHSEVGFHTASFERKELPLKPLNSTSKCMIKTQDDRIIDVECAETHIFRPFSAGFETPSGAMTLVSQRMRFMGEKRGRVAASVEIEPKSKGVTLVYEHDAESMKPVNSIVDRIDKVMARLVVSKDNMGAKQQSAHEFTQLVTLLRKVDDKRMTPLLEKYFSVYRQYFLDALTYCATPTCVSAVHKMIVNDVITGESMNMFLQGISMVAKPTKGMIRDVKEIAARKPSRQAFLTLGILMYRYCSANEEQCVYSKNNPITLAELFLEGKLGNSCNGQESSERVEEILMALKAIGNAGRPFRSWKTLLSCAKSATHMNITSAALDALRRMPCNAEMQERLHEMHENVNMDPEKRIQSYVALMRCPTVESIKRIVNHLEKEQSKQVGSFIWSHLSNVNESSDPRHTKTQEALAMVLKGKDLKEFNLPLTRFSKAFEGSVYMKYLKSGASVDGHLIYHPDSILPKSALLNMTANILDVPVHVFEMAARVEGIETLIEDLFGPEGMFPDNSIVKIFNYEFSAEQKAKLRQRRSTDNVNNNIKKLHEQVNKKRVNPSGSVSVKVLGHEMRVFSYEDIFWAVDQIDNMNVIDILLKVAKGGQKTFTKSVLFMEMTHSVPTGLGLPIKLNLKGSAVGSVELNGKFDIRNMFWGPRSMEIKGFMRPSAVVEVSGQMGVNSHYIDTGILVNSSMFTSSMIKGSVMYKEGKLLKVNIDAPEEPIEIFNVSSTPFLYANEEMQLVKGAPRRLSPDFCLKSKMVLGLGICTSMSVPVAFREYESPYFPLSGPAHYGMKIIKADPKLTTYQAMVSLNKKAIYNGYQMIGTIQFGTPGATYSRGMTTAVKYQETDKVRRLIVGEFQNRNSVELMVEYRNETNRVEVDFRSNLFTSKTARSRFVFFNETSDESKKIGVSVSAEYDWYKMQHVTDFTRSDKIIGASSNTTYWPGKFIAASATYTRDEKDIMIKLEANQLRQAIQMNGKYIKAGVEKGLNFTVKHLSSGKHASVYFGIVNAADTKKFVVNTTAFCGRVNEISLGYYRREISHVVELNAKVMNKTAAIFADFGNSKDGWYGLDIGARYESKMVGILSTLDKKSDSEGLACSTVYYNEKMPAKLCVELKKVSSEMRRLEWSAEILKRTGAVSFDFSNTDSSKGLTTTVKYNEKELMKNTMTFMYQSMWDNELKNVIEIGQRSLVARFYTERLANSDIAFGVEAKANDKFVKLQATYSTRSQADATSYFVTVEGWLNKKLPASYIAELAYGQQEMGLRSTVAVKDYQMTSYMAWKRAPSGKRTMTRFFGITKKDAVIFSADLSDTLSINKETKFFKSELRLTVGKRTLRYGWDMTFVNRCTDTKSAYALSFGIDYAQNRRSSITATVSNDEKKASLVIDFMYIPNRQVSHVISYDKQTRQLDVSIEFLPKMFVKFMGRLDKENGWKLTTDVKFSWVNFERVLTWVAAYVDRNEFQALSFKFFAYNKQFAVASEYNKETRTVTFSISGLGRTVRLTGFWLKERKIVGMRVVYDSVQGNVLVPVEVMEAVVGYSQKHVAFELRRKNVRYISIVSMCDKDMGKSSFEVSVLGKRVIKTIATLDKSKYLTSFELLIRDKSMFKVEGEVKKSDAMVVGRLFVLGKERFQTVAKYNKERMTALLSFDALKKNMNAVFAAKWNPERKEMTLSTEVLKRHFGVIGRFDPTNYVAGMYVFFQKHVAGWTTFYDAKDMAVAYNVTLTPRLSGQVVMQVIQDRIIAITLQRKFGQQIVNEASFKYELGADASKLIFHWNKDTTNKIKNAFRDTIIPEIKKAMEKVSDTTTKMTTAGHKFGLELVKNGTTQLLRLINEADRRFDEIDFDSIKENTGEMVIAGLKKTAEITNKALKLVSEMMTKLHTKLPEVMENTRRYARQSIELAQEALKESRVMIEQAKQVAQLAYKIAKNLTESGMPVVKTAIKLGKEFKVRGKTMEQIVSDLSTMIEKLARSWRKNLTAKVIKAKKDVIVYLQEMPVPYRKEKLGELFTLYMDKLNEFRANFNLEEKTRELKSKVMNYRIKGMTVSEHLTDLVKTVKKIQAEIKKMVNNLPEDIKKTAVKMIGETRIYMKKMRKMAKTVYAFTKPLVRCIKRVALSVDKHFGPLVNEAVQEIRTRLIAEYKKIYTPMKATLVRITEIIERFVKPFVKPMRPLYQKIEAQLRAIRVLEKELGPLVDFYLDQLKSAVERQLRKANDAVVARVDMIKAEYQKLAKMTPEELVVFAVDKSIELGVDATRYARDLYRTRREIMKQWKLRAEAYYKQMKQIYAFATSKPVEEMVHTAFKMTGEAVISTLKEFVKTIDQIASMDISKPLGEAWREMDLVNHLERYGLNSRIVNAIRSAKNVNLTQTLFRTIEASKKAMTEAYSLAEQKLEMAIKKLETVYKYIRAIPKRSFDDFYGEVESFYLKNQDDMYKMAKNLIIEGRARLMNALETAKKTYKLYIEMYGKPVVRAYEVIKNRAALVRAENEEECMMVFGAYKDTIKAIAMQRYSVARKYVESKYAMLKDLAEKRYQLARAYAEAKYNEYYQKAVEFYRRQEDKTWEQIGEELYDVAESYYKTASDEALVQIAKARKHTDKLVVKAKEIYAKVDRIVKKYVAIIKAKYENEVRPEMKRMYIKAINIYKETKAKALKQYDDYVRNSKALYKKIQGDVIEMYNANKALSIRQLYRKTVAIVYRRVAEQVTLVKSLANKHYNQAYKTVNAKFTDLKEGVNKIRADVMVVMPVVLFEAESMLNQTLRAVVIIANETVKAYTPHFNIVKAYAVDYYGKGVKVAEIYYKDGVAYTKRYYAEAKVKSVELYKRGQVELESQIKKVSEYVRELIEKIKSHPKYLEVMEHKYTKEAIRMLKELRAKLEPKIAELKVKMEELKTKMEPKIAELKAEIEKLKTHPKVVELKAKIAEYRRKAMALREHEYVLKAIEVLKQVQESSMFTLMQIKSKTMPYIESAKTSGKMVPSIIVYHAQLFRRDPAECVWVIVANCKSLINDIRGYDWKSIDVVKASKQLVVDVTDERTKDFAKLLSATAISNYKKCETMVKAVPKMIKDKATEIYDRQLKMAKKFYGDFKAAWERCPFYPIVNHEIWGELAAEVRNHEIVDTLITLAKQARYMANKYRIKYTKKVQEYMSLKRAEMETKYNAAVAKVNAFLDETTLEDIVNKAVESYNIAMNKVKETRQKAMEQFNKVYEQARKQYAMCMQKCTAAYKKYYAKAEEMWKKNYPTVEKRVNEMYEKAKSKIEKSLQDIKRYSKEMKEKMTIKALKTWNESELKRNLITLKGMTVGETVAEIKRLPQRARAMYAKAVRMAEAKVEEFKAYYDKNLKEHVEKVRVVVQAVVDEVNATGIFIYRYYDLPGNMYRARDFANEKMAEAKKYIKENAKKCQEYAKEYKEYAVKRVKEVLPKIPPTMRLYAQKFAKASLKSVHSSMVYADNFDVQPYITKIKMLKKYIPEFNKYIIVDTVDNQLVFRIPHYKTVEPSFTYQIKKADAKVRMAANKVRMAANKVRKDTIELTKRMIEYARNKTAEVREDFNMSLIAHSEFGNYFYSRATDISSRIWDRSMMIRSKLNETMREKLQDAKKSVEKYTKIAMNKGKEVSSAVIDFTKEAVVDVTYSNGLGDAYNKAEKYAKTAVEAIKAEMKPVYEAAKAYAKASYRDITLQYQKLVYKTEPYYLIVNTAIKEWRNGAEFRKAFRVVEVQLKKAYKSASDMLQQRFEEIKATTLAAIEQEDIRVVKEYLKSHKTILGKYAKRLYRLFKIGKVRLDRAMRKGKLMLRKQWKKQPLSPFESVAMIFGKNHVMTFDGKFYDVPSFPKGSCTYLLARDFKNGDFTILSQKENLIIQTPDMEVIIHQNGRVTSAVKVSKNGKKEVRDLPVETESGMCTAKREGVYCEFKQGVVVKCDKKHFLCTIKLSSWHYGSTEGLLGTNNNEVYDDFRLPDNTITESVSEFVNSWLVTRERGCMIKEENNEAPMCNKAPSEKCFALFKNKESRFSSLFGAVDPLPFLRACLVDTADCESKQDDIIAHCNVTKAYIRALRIKGHYTPQIDECMVYKKANGEFAKLGDKWIEPVSKDVDVVVLMSKRAKSHKLRRTLAYSLFSINRRLAKRGFNTRYALVGFGGNGMMEEAHVHTIGGNVFSDAGLVSSVIKEMKYNGKSTDNNDAYEAISLASKLHFRPGARKIFVLFNFDEFKPSFFGPTLDETMNDLKGRANATLIVFDDFKFMPYGKSRVIGQTETRVYLSPDYLAVPIEDYKMPRSEFTKLVRVSDGGMFRNEFRPTESKIMVTAVVDALLDKLNTGKSGVQCCRLNYYPKCKTTDLASC